MSDKKSSLTPSQEKLAKEIRRLCKKTHGTEHVIGWEVVLFRACTGQAMLPTVDYNDMANLLSLFITSGGWIMRVGDEDRFHSKDEWARILKTFEPK